MKPLTWRAMKLNEDDCDEGCQSLMKTRRWAINFELVRHCANLSATWVWGEVLEVEF